VIAPIGVLNAVMEGGANPIRCAAHGVACAVIRGLEVEEQGRIGVTFAWTGLTAAESPRTRGIREKEDMVHLFVYFNIFWRFFWPADRYMSYSYGTGNRKEKHFEN